MYTVKRIKDGDISGFETDNWTISRNSSKPGKAFLEAVEFARNPSGLSPEDEAQTLADIKAESTARLVKGETVETAADVCYEVSGVTVIRGGESRYIDTVLVGAVPGDRELEDALGVVITSREHDGEQEVQYDFIYPGMQVYITDRFGNTVESLR